jgi:hypothetical protein
MRRRRHNPELALNLVSVGLIDGSDGDPYACTFDCHGAPSIDASPHTQQDRA